MKSKRDFRLKKLGDNFDWLCSEAASEKNSNARMAQFFMSRARKLFQYVDLQGSTVPSPASHEGRVTSSMSIMKKIRVTSSMPKSEEIMMIKIIFFYSVFNERQDLALLEFFFTF